MYSRLIYQHGDDFCYVKERNSWASYSPREQVWSFGKAQEVVRHHLVDVVHNLALREDREFGTANEKIQGAWQGFKRRANSSNALINSTLERLDPNTPSVDGKYPNALSVKDFDSATDVLPFANGLVCMGTGEIRHYERDDKISKKLSFEYAPEAECPEWEAFLERAQPDPEVRKYIQRVAGYSAQALTSEKLFWVHEGVADAGKSTFVEVLSNTLGPFAHTPDKGLLQAAGDERPEKKPNLVGRRMLIVDEWPSGTRLNMALVKLISAGGKDNARHLYGLDFEFTHTGKLHFATNVPIRLELDSGLMRRLVVIPWTRPASASQRAAAAELTGGMDLGSWFINNERSGIANWLIRGYQDWRKYGLGDRPEVVAEATDRYLHNDPVQSYFLTHWERTNDPADKVFTSDVYDHYVKVCQETGQEPVSDRELTKKLKGLQVEHKRAIRIGDVNRAGFVGIRPQE
nr:MULTISPECIES: phage/plasmid primase, P4 family [unclassified Streptomyces]